MINPIVFVYVLASKATKYNDPKTKRIHVKEDSIISRDFFCGESTEDTAFEIVTVGPVAGQLCEACKAKLLPSTQPNQRTHKRKNRTMARKALYPVSSLSLLSDLNPEQFKAASHANGPMVILAQAGSGKTKTLISLVGNLSQTFDPTRILAVTFSKKAADEMQERGRKFSLKAKFSTWHAFALSVLKEDKTEQSTWNVDESDRAKYAIKDALGYRYLDWKAADISKVRQFITHCKANGLFPSDTKEVAELAAKHFTKPGDQSKAREAYKISQSIIENQGLLTFDDFLVFCLKHLEQEENRQRWASKFDWVLQDEAQDANSVQTKIALLLTRDSRNYVVVGDSAQCVALDTPIETPTGYTLAKHLTPGDEVLSYRNGKVAVQTISHRMQSSWDYGFKIVTESGRTLTMSPNHKIWATPVMLQEGSMIVYLMYRRDKGYRVGITNHGQESETSPYGQRTRGENAERLWVLEVTKDRETALEREEFYSLKFGVPTCVFNGTNRGINQSRIDNVFAMFGENGVKILNDKDLDFDLPHWVKYSSQTTAGQKLVVQMTAHGSKGSNVSFEWSGKDLADQLETAGYTVCHSKASANEQDRFRIRKWFQSYREALIFAEELSEEANATLSRRLSIPDSEPLRLLTASALHVGMKVPVLDDSNEVILETITSVERVSAQFVDLDVSDASNFFGDRILSHNSIYGFRGSSPQTIVDFEKLNPGCQVVTMNRNYRSSPEVVNVANKIIAPAKVRLPTDMVAERRTPGMARALSATDFDDEAREFVSYVNATYQEGGKYSDVTCLFRTNAQSRALEEALLSAKIPYLILGGTSFYERKEVKDLLGYLRVANGEKNEQALRCINAPFRYLGNAFIEGVSQALLRGASDVTEAVQMATQRTGIQARQRAAVSDWLQIVNGAKSQIAEDQTPSSILNWIVSQTKFIEWLTKDEGEESIESSHAANVRELIRVSTSFNKTSEFLAYVDRSIKAAAAQRKDQSAGGDRVLLMSIHRSKGLEWPKVWVVGLNENLLPHKFGDPEEERRLAYVAATRARDELTLSYVKQFATAEGVKVALPSQFLLDAGLILPPEQPQATRAHTPFVRGK